MLVSLTVAPGTTAPAASTTAPRKPPVVADCAHRQEEAAKKAAAKAPQKAKIARLRYRNDLSCWPLISKACHSYAREGTGSGTIGMRFDCRTAAVDPWPDNLRSTMPPTVSQFNNAPQYRFSCRSETPLWGVLTRFADELNRRRSEGKARRSARRPDGAGACRRWPKRGSDPNKGRRREWCTG